MARYRTGQERVGRNLSPQQLLRIGVRAAEKRMAGKRPSEATFKAGERAAFDAITIADPQAGTSTHQYRAARYSHGVSKIAHRATQLARRLLWAPASHRPAWAKRVGEPVRWQQIPDTVRDPSRDTTWRMLSGGRWRHKSFGLVSKRPNGWYGFAPGVRIGPYPSAHEARYALGHAVTKRGGRRDPATKSYRGWSIERETGAVHLGYQTASGKRGKGRKISGYWLTRKPDESGYVAKKWVDTLADAKRYIDEYEGAVERDRGWYRHPRLHRRAAKLGLERHPRKRRTR